MPTYRAADDTVLHYDELTGSAAAGQPVVVLAGGAARHPDYLGDLGGLARRHPLVLPHLRGVGESPAPDDLADRLRAVTAPALVVAGAEDAMAGLAPVRALSELFPDGRLAIVDDCGHYPWVEQPAAFRAAVEAFLREVVEVPLLGGDVSAGVVRVGDTVRRHPAEGAAAVHAYLRHLERQGFAPAPRFLGIDERGREILS